MKKIANGLAILSAFLVVYCFIAKATGASTVHWGIVTSQATAGLIVATYLMLGAVLVRLSVREKGGTARTTSWKGIGVWLLSVVTIGWLLGGLSIFLITHLTHSQEMTDRKAIERFHQILWNSFHRANPVSWLGIVSRQNPLDNWVVQEIISEVKPDVIVETGTGQGGSTLFYAAVLEQVNPEGKVITIDIEQYIDQASQFDLFQRRVEFIQGDSASPEIVQQVAEKVKGRKVLVTLDSLHTKEHVLKELNLYSNLVSLNSYIVVQDTNQNGHPILTSEGPGPMEAVEEFLKSNKNFEVDREREKFYVSFYPSGFLKRVK